jgi:predicted PurR-regulated permease PerM
VQIPEPHQPLPPPLPSGGGRERTEITVSNRTILRVLAMVALFSAFLAFLSLISSVLQLVLLAIYLAVALNPLVTGLERRWGLQRGPAALLVFVLTIALLVGLVTAIVTPLYNELREFVDNSETYVAELRNSSLIADLDARYDVLDRVEEQAAALPGRLPATAGSVFGAAGFVFGAVFQTLTVLFLTLFLLLELPAIARSIASLLSPNTAERASTLSREITTTVSRYVAGALFIALIAGTVTAITLLIVGVPYAFALGLLMSLFALIPLVGATIGTVFVALVALTQGVVPAIVVIIVLVVYQQIENNFLQPMVMQRSVSVSPFIILLSVLVGTNLLGILGALLAIPAAGSIQILLREVIASRRRAVTTEHVVAGIDPPPAL